MSVGKWYLRGKRSLIKRRNFRNINQSNISSIKTVSYLPTRLNLTNTINMSSTGQKLKVAAIQAEPVWNDLEGGVNKSIALIEEAAKKGAQVVGFPEVFIPGYPW